MLAPRTTACSPIFGTSHHLTPTLADRNRSSSTCRMRARVVHYFTCSVPRVSLGVPINGCLGTRSGGEARSARDVHPAAHPPRLSTAAVHPPPVRPGGERVFLALALQRHSGVGLPCGKQPQGVRRHHHGHHLVRNAPPKPWRPV